MKIRLIKKDDIKEATKLYCSIWPEDETRKIKKYLQDKVKNKECFVAVSSGRIIGILCFSKNFFKKADFLEEVAVDKIFRKKGIASALIKKFEENAKKRRLRRIFSSIEPNNKISIKMHKKLGYVNSGYVNHIWDENKREIIFSKKL